MGYSNYRSTIILDDDDYTALIDRDGTRLDESTSAPEDVIKAACDRGGSINFQGSGDVDNPHIHLLSSGLTTLTGFQLKPKTEIHFESGVELHVPNGYSNGVFVVDPTYVNDTIRDVVMTGTKLRIKEQGTPAQLWTGILVRLSHASKGVSYCTLGQVHTFNARSTFAVDQQQTAGWFTSNVVEHTNSYFGINGYEFINSAGATPRMSNSTNTFHKMEQQMSTQTLYGWKNIDGNNCTFDNCGVWDQHNAIPGNFKVSQWAASATNMRVIGGVMLNDNVEMLCPPNQVRFDEGHSPNPLVGDSYTYHIDIAGVAGQMTYQLPHGLGAAPRLLKGVVPVSNDAASVPFKATRASTYILITCLNKPFPPSRPGNVNNLGFEVTVSSRTF